MARAFHAVPLDHERPDCPPGLGVGAQGDRPSRLVHEGWNRHQLVGIGDLVVGGHHVVGLPVVLVDPDAGRVDVAVGGLQGLLGHRPGADVDFRSHLPVGIHMDFRIVHFHGRIHVHEARHLASHFGHIVELIAQLVQVLVPDFQDNGRKIAIGEHAGHQAARCLEELHTGEVFVEDVPGLVSQFLLACLALLHVRQGELDEAGVGPWIGAVDGAPCGARQTQIGEDQFHLITQFMLQHLTHLIDARRGVPE